MILFYSIPKQRMNISWNKKKLVEFMCNDVVNETFNMNFTTKGINDMKFKAFMHFKKTITEVPEGKQSKDCFLCRCTLPPSMLRETQVLTQNFCWNSERSQLLFEDT